jgi:hypothetical protein
VVVQNHLSSREKQAIAAIHMEATWKYTLGGLFGRQRNPAPIIGEKTMNASNLRSINSEQRLSVRDWTGMPRGYDYPVATIPNTQHISA